MCRVLHVEWRCKHTQNIWEYCRDATAPSRTPSAEQAKQPCEAFVAKHTLTPSGPTEDEYRNFCCKFVCCLEDQADLYKQVLDLESALGLKPNESIPHIPSLFLSRQQKSLKELRKKFQSLVKRHEERCEALYYELGVVQESDSFRAPAERFMSKKKQQASTKRWSGSSSRSIRSNRYYRRSLVEPTVETEAPTNGDSNAQGEPGEHSGTQGLGREGTVTEEVRR